MTTSDESPIIRTSPKRMTKGILIVSITLAIGGAVLIPFWQTMIDNPPVASTLKQEEPPPLPSGTQTSIGNIEGVTKQQPANVTTGGAAAPAQAPAQPAGPPGTPLTILEGSSVQGNPSYDPATLTVKKGDKITVTNKDTLPHTVTSGTGPTDPSSAKQFDTSIIEAGATADIETTNINPGQNPFYCTVHPYMTGKLDVQQTSKNATSAQAPAPNATSAQAPAPNATSAQAPAPNATSAQAPAPNATSWPLCPAGFVPMKEFIIEYFHRTVAATTGIMVFVTMFFTLRSKEASRSTKIASMIAGALVVGQITLGAFVIVEKLHALLVTMHLGMGLILFLMILTVTLDVNQFSKSRLQKPVHV